MQSRWFLFSEWTDTFLNVHAATEIWFGQIRQFSQFIWAWNRISAIPDGFRYELEAFMENSRWSASVPGKNWWLHSIFNSTSTMTTSAACSLVGWLWRFNFLQYLAPLCRTALVELPDKVGSYFPPTWPCHVTLECSTASTTKIDRKSWAQNENRTHRKSCRKLSTRPIRWVVATCFLMSYPWHISWTRSS